MIAKIIIIAAVATPWILIIVKRLLKWDNDRKYKRWSDQADEYFNTMEADKCDCDVCRDQEENGAFYEMMDNINEYWETCAAIEVLEKRRDELKKEIEGDDPFLGCNCSVCRGEATLDVMSGHAISNPDDLKFWMKEPDGKPTVESVEKYLKRWEDVGAQVEPTHDLPCHCEKCECEAERIINSPEDESGKQESKQ